MSEASSLPERPAVEVRVVDASRGAAWWATGWRIFAVSVFPWMGVMLVYLILAGTMSAIPYVGDLGHWLLTPVFMGGIMLGCQALERGEKLRFEHLFEGFQGQRFGTLVIIGAVNIGLFLAIVAIGATGVFGFVQVSAMTQPDGDPLMLLDRLFGGITATSIVAGLLVVIILAVFAMLNLFAPALVALHGVPAVDAMKLSFMSCTRNWAAFLVYGAIGIAIMLALGIVFVLLVVAAFAGGAAGILSGSISAGIVVMLVGLALLFFVLMLGAGLVLGPIVFGSTYAGYKDTLAPQDFGASVREHP